MLANFDCRFIPTFVITISNFCAEAQQTSNNSESWTRVADPVYLVQSGSVMNILIQNPPKIRLFLQYLFTKIMMNYEVFGSGFFSRVGYGSGSAPTLHTTNSRLNKSNLNVSVLLIPIKLYIEPDPWYMSVYSSIMDNLALTLSGPRFFRYRKDQGGGFNPPPFDSSKKMVGIILYMHICCH